jgi:hypothetical protein
MRNPVQEKLSASTSLQGRGSSMCETVTLAPEAVARPDTDFEVVELLGGVLLVGSPSAGFETVSIAGYRSELLAKVAERFYSSSRLWRH